MGETRIDYDTVEFASANWVTCTVQFLINNHKLSLKRENDEIETPVNIPKFIYLHDSHGAMRMVETGWSSLVH